MHSATGGANGDPNTKVVTLESNQPNAHFGYSVASAGDIDADGFSDVLVGARFYTNGEDSEGAAYVYRGTVNGLDKNNPVIIEGNQVNAAMGNKVSSAGDVNGDGYSDVLISAYLHDGYMQDDGAVYLHYGSNAGISSTPKKRSLASMQTTTWVLRSLAQAM
ncbi:FG-GAP repeat-containing protein [Dyadobacter soli]|uniref:FG-GAP repeat-containing protein n=1 Tax=Dyadobacter soli TaxID=659014 RepID=A0A1G8C1G7_9BACT|nr:integrin alpha [Dyadobacter soli]SDH39189.1 FG-GAP repeat-containing protein [Dyadobacter soli]